MQSLQPEKVGELIKGDQFEIECLKLALSTAKTVLSSAASGKSWRLQSHSSVSLCAPKIAATDARAEILTEPGFQPATCKVTVVQSGPDAESQPIIEVTCSFLGDLSSETPEAMLTPATNQKLSDTANARRRQIFEGACRIIAKRGFGNATMREIAKEAGLSVPLMYKYIKDKDDILYLITTISMQDIIDFFDTEEFVLGSAKENLEKAVDKYLDYIGKNRRHINLVYSETRSLSAENRARIFAMERAFMERWQAILDRGVEQGSLREMDTALMSNYIYFLCTIWSLRYWSIGEFGEDTVRESLKTFILEGVLKAQR